ncbi:MAG: hypothetical protein GY810_27035 [Aureispira sp.]|nr:hypothetical protein [Aureispira sp.]
MIRISILFKAFFVVLILKTSCQAQQTSFLNPSDLRLMNNAVFLSNFEFKSSAKSSINSQQSFIYDSNLKTLDWNSYLASNTQIHVSKIQSIGLGGYFKGNLHRSSHLRPQPNQQELALGGSYKVDIYGLWAKSYHTLTLGSMIKVNRYNTTLDNPIWVSKLNFGLLWQMASYNNSHKTHSQNNFGISLQNLHFLKTSNPEINPFFIKLHSQHQYILTKSPIGYSIKLYADISTPIKHFKQLQTTNLSYNISLESELWRISHSQFKYNIAVQYGVSDLEQDQYLGGALGIRIHKFSIKLQYHKSLSSQTIHYSGLLIKYLFFKDLTKIEQRPFF